MAVIVSEPEKMPGCSLMLTEGELPRFRNSGNEYFRGQV